MLRKLCLLLVICVAMPAAVAQESPSAPEIAPVQGDFVIKDFRFRSGGLLPELRLHYRTLGTPRRNAAGVVTNAVLIMHGTAGSGAQFLRPEFSGELFRPGGLLDLRRYFIVLPDAIGHGQSSKPSDGLHARFPITVTATWSRPSTGC